MTGSYALKRLGLWLGIGLAYVLAAWVSLQLPRPDDFITPVYLPAGIALAAILVFGVRSWPGIFLGALAWGATVSHWGREDEIVVLWALFINPVSVTLQALLGGLLARKLLDWPHPLDSLRSVLTFILVVVPLSCLINASVSVPMLWNEVLPSERGPFILWLQWWQGDMLGSLLLIPIALVFFGQPREVWRPRRLGLSIPLLATGLLTILVFRQVALVEDGNRESSFQLDAERTAHQVERHLFAQLDMIRVLQRFLAISPELDRQTFQAFVALFLERHPGAQNFSFNPRVSQQQRLAFEQRQAEVMGFPYAIRDRRPDGALHPAEDREQYFPILFVEPMASNRLVLGLDPVSISAPRRAIDETIDTGEPIASEPFRLTQEAEDQLGVVVYAAVHRSRAVHGEVDDDGVIGLATAAFRMDHAIQSMVEDGLARGMQLCLLDRTGEGEIQGLAGEGECLQDDWSKKHALSRSQTIDFAGREWELRLVGTPQYTGVAEGWPMWTAGLAGLFLTGTLGAFLLLFTGQARRVSNIVDQRTRQLAVATDELREQQEALNRAQGIARMGSWEVDLNDGSFHASQGLARILYCGQSELQSMKDLLEQIHHQDRDSTRQIIDRAEVETGMYQMNCRPESASDRVLRLVVESDWRGGQAWRLRGIAQDVTEARDAAEKIERLAHYDELTGLPNRSLWLECTRSALESARRHEDSLAVMFLDLDEFKTINDSLGHSVGDLLLTAIAERLRDSIRSEDILARLGGDEFVLLLPRLKEQGSAQLVAEKMMASLSEPVAIGGHELKLTASIGIALYPNHGDSVEALLQHADTAMYRAKEAGRNNAKFFEPGMSDDARERLFIESGIRKGLDDSQFLLHFQPQIDCNTGRTVGLESLVRWAHPQEGLLMPVRFIAAAERSGLIIPLGDWVLHEACRQQAALAKQGYGDVTVAANISALQFRREVFVDRMGSFLEQTGANPERIKLEITESTLMDLSQNLLGQLRALREMGLTFALDDFGTGYSSLSYLKRLPISQIKLDRSFVMDLPDDSDDAAIAETAIAMARNLGMQVVAEGVETQAQKEFLLARGCHIMQGFLFAKPMPLEDLDLSTSYMK
ncbi:diguanylate cyclase (GGDEF)-like protein [Natronospira proteinivora]|uniref:Diguanylate cyclase (GGDEF)-like protein n=1 Tax=Natronospira proteinivora TaxID=1807133 RepID=A0ABT1G618_9GAMM|nr:EAL domain-containing protein [Natronospira proteinivora]MCP1726744.1 diguanylate cyclase (GGDEF)-like protein [Natronospira proteinivora]